MLKLSKTSNVAHAGRDGSQIQNLGRIVCCGNLEFQNLELLELAIAFYKQKMVLSKTKLMWFSVRLNAKPETSISDRLKCRVLLLHLKGFHFCLHIITYNQSPSIKSCGGFFLWNIIWNFWLVWAGLAV